MLVLEVSMKKNKGKKRRRTRRRYLWITIAAVGAIAFVAAICIVVALGIKRRWETPQELLLQYMDYIPSQEYEKMYAILCGAVSDAVDLMETAEDQRAIHLLKATVCALEDLDIGD